MSFKSTLTSFCLFILAFLAGCLIVLGFAPFSFWISPLVALLILSFSLSLASSNLLQKVPSLAILRINKTIAFAFSFGLLLGGCHWVYVSMVKFGGTPVPLAIILTALFCGFIASLLLPFIYLEQKLATHSAVHRSLLFAAIWVLCEWFRSWFLTGFPWLYVGYSHIDGPLANYAPYISVYGISFLVAFSAMAVAQLLMPQTQSIKPRLQKAALLVSLCVIRLLPLTLSPLELTENKSDTPISVALV
ncbi:MAG: hypothetical protein KAG18_07070, partial [Sinobacterium sp.]|nr:hypothetical protein [Sinobacterium sp.]